MNRKYWKYTGELTEQPDAPPAQPTASIKKMQLVSAQGHAVEKCQIPALLSVAQREQFVGMPPGSLARTGSSSAVENPEQEEQPIRLPPLQQVQPAALPVRTRVPFLKGSEVSEFVSDDQKERYN